MNDAHRAAEKGVTYSSVGIKHGNLLLTSPSLSVNTAKKVFLQLVVKVVR